MSSIKCIVLGAGGHAKVVIEILRGQEQVELVGILDPNPSLHGKELLGVPVLGDDSLIADLSGNATHFVMGFGTVRSTALRARLYSSTIQGGLLPLSVIHPSVICSRYAQLGEGVQLLPRVVVNTEAEVQDNAILNTGAIVEHHCFVGKHAHIATGAILCGQVHIEEEAHIGAGAVVRQSITVGSKATVGVGAVVVKDVPAGATVIGNPARIL